MYIYVFYMWMGVQQSLVEKQNICYLDTISGLGCLLPRNKYTALAPYFCECECGGGEYLLTHRQLCERLGLDHTHLTVVIVIVT